AEPSAVRSPARCPSTAAARPCRDRHMARRPLGMAARSSLGGRPFTTRVLFCVATMAIAGCNGATQQGAGDGGSGGAGGAGGGGGARSCGGIAGLACDVGSWCDYPAGTCGSSDQQGVCTPRPQQACDLTTCSAVCGCNGKSYCNACVASLAGFDTTATPSCIKGNGADGDPCGKDGDCQSTLKCCRACGAVSCPLTCLAAPGGGCPP